MVKKRRVGGRLVAELDRRAAHDQALYDSAVAAGGTVGMAGRLQQQSAEQGIGWYQTAEGQVCCLPLDAGGTPGRKGQEQRSGLPVPRVIDACLPVVKHAIKGGRVS